MINEYYANRKFFQISKLSMFYYFVRYLSFFIISFTFYFMYDSTLNIKWNDMISILLIFCINEVLKIWYKMLPPYDESEHIKFNIIEIYGDNLGSIIWKFLDDTCDGNQTKESYHSVINDDSGGSMDETVEMTNKWSII